MFQQSVLFVCLGNICRSPLAEGVFRHLVEREGLGQSIRVDSAGTGSWHVGDPPDRRSIKVAADYGIDLTILRGRQLTRSDFTTFDLIIGMDRSNVATILSRAPEGERHRVRLFADVTAGGEWDVPDPYYGTMDDFAAVYQMVSDGCMSLLGKLKSSDASLSGNTSSVR